MNFDFDTECRPMECDVHYLQHICRCLNIIATEHMGRTFMKRINEEMPPHKMWGPDIMLQAYI